MDERDDVILSPGLYENSLHFTLSQSLSWSSVTSVISGVNLVCSASYILSVECGVL